MESKRSKAWAFPKDFFRKPGPSPALTYRDLLFFARYVRPLWKMGLAGLVLALAGAALGSLLPLSGKVLIDYAVMKKGTEGVSRLLSSLDLSFLIPAATRAFGSVDLVILFFLLLGAAAGIIGIAQRYLMIRFQQEYTFSLQSALFDRLLSFPISFFRRGRTGYLMARVSDDIYALQLLFSESVPQAAAKVFAFAFGMSVLFALSVKLAFVSLCVLPAYALINCFFAGRLREASIAERETSARVSGDMQEVIAGVETIKAYAAEERETMKVSEGMRTVVETRFKRMALSLFSDYAGGASRFAATLLIMWLGAKEMSAGRLTAGDFVAFTSYAIYLSGAASGVLLFRLMLEPVFASMGRLMELFALTPECSGEEPQDFAEVKIRGEIVFREVSFSYEKDLPVLKDISFSAAPGQITALVGPSGAGKTTVVNLLLKLCEPLSGAIFLDGRDLRSVPPRWLRQQVGFVSQEAFLFNDSIEKNIRFGKPEATKEEVIAAARMANIDKEIGMLPEGYDTVIGERGVTLSAGQRQRISMARAFLKNPAILILDEPTSALDPAAEGLIKESLKKLAADRTTFIIAHRLSLIDIADRVLTLEKGKILESGVWEP